MTSGGRVMPLNAPIPKVASPPEVARTQLLADLEWQRIDLADRAAVETTRQAAVEICKQDPRATLEHDFAWLLGNYAGTQGVLSIWLCRHGKEAIGYAALTASPTKLRPSIGERAAASWQVERHTLVGCPLFAASRQDQSRQLTLNLLNAIRSSLPDKAVLMLLGARADSALFDLVGDAPNELPFLVAAYGPPYERRLIELG